jgi:MFS family permease
LIRGLAGVFTAGLIPAVASMVGDLALENRRAQWIGIVNGGASVGWIIGPIFGGLLYDSFGYSVPFAISIAIESGALFLALFLVPETYNPSARSGGIRPAWMRGLAALPTIYLIMLISFTVMFAWAFIEPQFMFYAYDDLVWTSFQLGLVMSTYGMACAFGEFALGRLSDRLGRKPVLVLGLALFSAQFIGLVIFRDAIWLGASFILAGLGNSLYDPALSAHVLDITPPEHTARIMGFKATAGSLGNMLGPALVVLFAPFVGPQGVFRAAAALVLVVMLATAFALRVPQRKPGLAQFSNAKVSQ